MKPKTFSVMKKLFVILALSLAALTAKAQVYVGGGLSFVGTAANGENAAVFSIAPEVGYNFNDDMAAGVSLGLGFSEGVTVFDINPYFRYYFAEVGPVRFFGDAKLNFTNTSSKVASSSTWGVGVAAGIAVPLNDKWSFVTHVCSLGYYGNTFNFGINPGSTIGVYYAF